MKPTIVVLSLAALTGACTDPATRLSHAIDRQAIELKSEPRGTRAVLTYPAGEEGAACAYSYDIAFSDTGFVGGNCGLLTVSCHAPSSVPEYERVHFTSSHCQTTSVPRAIAI